MSATVEEHCPRHATHPVIGGRCLACDLGLDGDGAPPPLLPELEAHLRDRPIGRMVVHPLVVDLYSPHKHASLNERLLGKQAQVAKDRAARKWEDVIWLHERPFRTQALLELEPVMPEAEWWALAGIVWIDSENLHEYAQEWADLLARPNAHLMMDDAERAALSALPERFTVYRGAGGPEAVGNSWTQTRETAEFFARRLGRTPWVLTGRVEREHVVAYFHERAEDEIVVLPEHVRVSRRVRLKK